MRHEIDLHAAKHTEARAWPSDWILDGLEDWGDEGPIPSLLAYRDEHADDPLVTVEIAFDEGTASYLVHAALLLDDVEPVATREAAQARYDELVGSVTGCASSISSPEQVAARSEP